MLFPHPTDSYREERKPKLDRFLGSIQLKVKGTTSWVGADKVWGVYIRFLRGSADQVPFCFGENGGATIDFIGADRVQIFTGRGDSDMKRMGTLQLYVYNLPKSLWQLQPRLALIFPGANGTTYYDKEEKLHDTRVDVHRQKKAWFDRPTGLAWAERTAKRANLAVRKHYASRPHMYEQGRTPVPLKAVRVLAFMDNLDAHHQPPFQKLMKESGADTWYGPANMTDDWQIVDDGVGKAVKDEMGEELDEMQMALTNSELEKMTAGDRRVMITKAAARAYEKVIKMTDFHKKFDARGATVNAEGTPAEVNIKFPSQPAGEKESFKFSIESDGDSDGDGDGDGHHSDSDGDSDGHHDNDDEAEDIVIDEPGERGNLDSDNEHPSDVDEQDSADELEEWPQELNVVYSPAADDGAMAARLTKGAKVARFFHGEGWCVGHVKRISAGVTYIKYLDCPDLCPIKPGISHTFDNEDYGVERQWLLITKR